MTAPAADTATAGHGLLPSLPLDRRGRLKNGARPGDFLAAPRCGARTRCGGCCRQPAMTNGRCRLHGGLSTGPRTPEGRARCARARLIHGGYSRATRALQEEARSLVRRLRGLRLGLRAGPTAGHGVLSLKPSPSSRQADQRRKSEAIRVDRRSSAVESSSTAGHGVLPRRPSFLQRALLRSTAIHLADNRPALPAG